MKSIRKRLILWLLLGLSVLWAAAGAGIYYTVHRSELTRLDAQLDKMEGVARYIIFTTSRGPDSQPRTPRPDRSEGAGSNREAREVREDQRNRRPEDRWPDFFEATGTSFFQVWNSDRKSRHKSDSLGERELEFPTGADRDNPLYYNTTLADGTELRAKATLLRPPGFGRPRGRPNDPPRRPSASNGSGAGSATGNNGRFTSLVALDRSGMNESLASLLWGIAGVGIAAALASVTLIHFALKDGLRPLRRLGDQLADIDAQSLDGRFSSKELPAEISPVADRLNELMGRLEGSFERERRFSADLAHELRTPVAELRTMAEVALRWPDGKDPQEAEATLEIF